jgi:hypothetical protein
LAVVPRVFRTLSYAKKEMVEKFKA